MNDADVTLSSAIDQKAPGDRFYVVGVGASAGGLEALRTFLSRMPPRPGIAFVVVVHLSPEHDSLLAELLRPYTSMPVQQVNETVALEADHVYVIPPNANLNSIDTHLRLSDLEERRSERAPIDHFLHTLAETHGEAAIGVVLTGSGSDGALGLRQIKKYGGLTVVQDPDEAEFDSMPRSAIATGNVDLVLPVRHIADELVLYCRTQPRLPTARDAELADDTERRLLQQIISEVRQRTERDFRLYDAATVLQRIARRMRIQHVETLEAYRELLRERPDEVRAFANDLLPSVSEFFREPDVFARLEAEVLPRLVSRKAGPAKRLRVWSIGCSSGEEAYSLCMLLLELAAQRHNAPVIQVFASDMSEPALSIARAALYPREIAESVGLQRLQRFFEEEMGRYRVRREVRDKVVFARHNLFNNPPYCHLDLIVCRNLLRELKPDVRRGVLNLFHYALEPHGVLVVSADDPVDEEFFRCEDGNAQIWQRRQGPAHLDLPDAMQPFRAPGELPTSPRYVPDFGAMHRKALERYAPPSVLLDADDRVVHYSRNAARYLQMPGGEPTQDVLKIVREPLRSDLAVALQAVRRGGEPGVSRAVSVATEAGTRHMTLRVDPLDDAAAEILIVFEEERAGWDDAPAGTESRNPANAAGLEHELAETKARLLDARSTAQQASNMAAASRENAGHELRFVAEELQSAQEELQRAQEELETANEELRTLDDENRRRLDELAEISGDLQRLLESTGVASLFVDRGMHIMRFTPQIAELFNVRYTDIGRPLSDLTHQLRHDDLESDVKHIFEHPAPLDREVQAENGGWYLMRILPYRPASSSVDGAVLTFIDISVRRQAEENLREADRRKDEFLAVLAHELRNPLAPISAGAEVLKTSSADPRVVAQVAATLARQTQQLVRLVDDLLEVSRISGGKLRLSKSIVRLDDVVRDAVSTAQPVMERRGHQLQIVLPPEPILLDADAARLTQVLANLLNNAARYTPDDGRIELRAERRGDSAIVRVKDNGIGIARHALPRVFEMFYQDRDSRFARNSGLGIGLTLAKSLVEMHGGSIDVDSPGADRGSVFTVRLPVARAGASAPEPERHRTSLGEHRVLIVDDNADAAETLCMLVKSLGDNEVQTASSGAQALETARELQPDVVLLDLMMPGMDGYEVARLMRQESWGQNAQIVAVSGWGQEEHRRRTREAGFDRHLTKPADVSELESLLGETPTRTAGSPQPVNRAGM